LLRPTAFPSLPAHTSAQEGTECDGPACNPLSEVIISKTFSPRDSSPITLRLRLWVYHRDTAFKGLRPQHRCLERIYIPRHQFQSLVFRLHETRDTYLGSVQVPLGRSRHFLDTKMSYSGVLTDLQAHWPPDRRRSRSADLPWLSPKFNMTQAAKKAVSNPRTLR
jgi:hypothetical protein